ncbi:MAG: TetR/AcrR family transcriptional regulator [Phormidesmis sp.]
MTTKKIAGRGRPRGFDIEAAIATAMALFHQRGYDGVGIAELSRSIGITAPSLYSAFGSKRELFERVLEHYVQAKGRWLPSALATEGSLEAVVCTLFLRAAETYAANPDCPGCLIIDGARNCADPQIRSLTAGFSNVTRQLICDRIAADASPLATPAVDALADYVMIILVGLSGSARDGMSLHALQTSAEIAATGFSQRLQQYRTAAHLSPTTD